MLKKIFSILTLSYLFLQCQSNNVLKEATFYQFLEQELTDRKVLLLDTNVVFIDCYLEDIFFATKDKKRVVNCPDSLLLLQWSYTPSAINHLIESPIDTSFLWQQKINSHVIQIPTLKKNTLIIDGAIPVIIEGDTLYHENDKKYLQPIVEWSVPYFTSDPTRVFLKEHYYLSPIEKTTIFKSYVFENNNWKLENKIKTDSVSLIGHIRYIKLTPKQQHLYNPHLYGTSIDTIGN